MFELLWSSAARGPFLRILARDHDTPPCTRISSPRHVELLGYPTINTITISEADPTMFKKDLTPGSRSKVKSSVQRALRNQFVETHPGFEPYIDEVLPKKASLEAVKLPDRAVLYVVDSKPIFFQTAHSPLLPHLRILHEFPNALPTIGIDRGAIRFVLSGATLMAPGLTSPGGRLPDPLNNPEDKPLQAGAIVGITAEGKQEICMVGELKMGTEEMKAKNKGAVIDEGHYLGDGLWKLAFD